MSLICMCMVFRCFRYPLIVYNIDYCLFSQAVHVIKTTSTVFGIVIVVIAVNRVLRVSLKSL